MTDFAGFPAETQKFLKGLSKNNNKEWFDAHRSDYDDHWVTPAKAFVEAAGEALQDLAPVEAQPRVNGSIFRVNRDVRFSADKRPYKDHLDFWFWEGERKTAVSGFYLRITPTEVGIGVGAHGFDKDRLAKYRITRRCLAVSKLTMSLSGSTCATTPCGLETMSPPPPASTANAS